MLILECSQGFARVSKTTDIPPISIQSIKIRLSKTKSNKTFLLEPNLKTTTIRVITKLPNSEQSYKGKVKTHNYVNKQNQSTTGKL
jgi:hypothetical protein